jgi:hypothetical protein
MHDLKEKKAANEGNNIQDGDMVGYGWSYGATASVIGGGGMKYYDIWDMHGGHEIFKNPFGAIGIDISTELNFVWITSVNGNDFNVSDFYGFSTSMNVSIPFIGGTWVEAENYNLFEIGATLGVLPFSVTITPGKASTLGQKEWNYSNTRNYIKTGGLH